MAILEVIDLHKSFGKTEVLKGISFSMEPGQVLSIIGSSAAARPRCCAASTFWKRRTAEKSCWTATCCLTPTARN